MVYVVCVCDLMARAVFLSIPLYVRHSSSLPALFNKSATPFLCSYSLTSLLRHLHFRRSSASSPLLLFGFLSCPALRIFAYPHHVSFCSPSLTFVFVSSAICVCSSSLLVGPVFAACLLHVSSSSAFPALLSSGMECRGVRRSREECRGVAME